MRTTTWFLVCSISLWLAGFGRAAELPPVSQGVQRTDITGVEFTCLKYGSYNVANLARATWHSVKLPGDSIKHLREAGLETADPNVGDNMKQYLKYEAEDFIYRTTLPMAKPGVHYRLTCDGLDTWCDIYIQGKKVHEHVSSFVRLDLDITPYLAAQPVEVLFVFKAPVLHAKQLYPHGNPSKLGVLFDEPWRIYIRKPQMHYGWDNAPHLAGVGFIGTPRLVAVAAPAYLRDMVFDCNYQPAQKTAEVGLRGWGVALRDTQLRVTLSDERGTAMRSELKLNRGALEGQKIAAGTVANVREWNPKGYGDPHRYDLAVETLENGVWMEVAYRKVGIRDLRLSTRVVERRKVNYKISAPPQVRAPAMDGGIQAADKPAANLVDGLDIGAWSKVRTAEHEEDVEEFRFIINGKPVFLTGFDWQPLEQALANISAARWQRNLELFDACGVNALRIWGGGYIEDERLYDFCDAHGILVWQDFQFACALYPDGDARFRDIIAADARDIFLRLNLHPSLAAFCGSNEIDMALYDRKRDPEKENTIGHALIPATLAALGSKIPYHPSSPGGVGYPRNPFTGENRNWSAQKYIADDYPALRGDDSIFISEGGCPGLPSASVMTNFFDPTWPLDEAQLEKLPVYLLHAGSTLNYYRKENFVPMYQGVREHFGSWKTLDELIYLSQVAQAQALERYMEIFRWKEDYCGGALLWKFADTWPDIEYAVVDYAGQPKLAYYAVQRAAQPLVVIPFLDGDAFRFGVSSLNTALPNAELVVRVVAMDGRVLETHTQNLQVRSGINRLSLALPRAKLRADYGVGKVLLHAVLQRGGAVLAERLFVPETFKQMALPPAQISATLESVGQADGYHYRLRLKSDVMVLGVSLALPNGGKDCVLSDNGFNLLAGVERTITLTAPQPLAVGDIKVSAYNPAR